MTTRARVTSLGLFAGILGVGLALASGDFGVAATAGLSASGQSGEHHPEIHRAALPP